MQKKTKTNRYLLTICFVFSVFVIKAQDPVLWLRGDNTGNFSATWQDASGNNNHAYSPTALNTNAQLNFNPAVNFLEVTDSLVVDLDLSNQDYMKIFTVFRGQKDTTDQQTIWAVGDKTYNTLRLTGQKLYNYPKTYRYTGGNISKPVISLVVRYNSNTPDVRNEKLYIGSSYEGSLLSNFFNGELAEMLVFTEELGFYGQKSIESYLAIKYGVCLYGDYYKANGDIIWSEEGNAPFTYNVFAIGRDDNYSLCQKQSASVEDSSLTISANRFAESNAGNLSELPDESYLFFSDNGEGNNAGTSVEPGETGSYYLGGKIWKTNAIGGHMYRIPLALKVKMDGIFDTVPDEFYLVRDVNRNGEFSEIELVLPDSTTADGYAYFSGIKFCTSDTDEDYFTFALSSVLEVTTTFVAPACEGAYGKVYIEVEGGIAPFTYQLKDENGILLKEWISSESSVVIDSLLSGQYKIDITDVGANRYGFDIDGQLAIETPGFGLNNIYSYQGIPLEFDLCDIDRINLSSCNWKKDQETLSKNCKVSVSEEGTYAVEILTAEGCSFTRQFYVMDETNTNDTTTSVTVLNGKDNILVVPNPASGMFKVHINLTERKDLMLYITGSDGSLIESRELKNIRKYIFNGDIQMPGVYLLTLVLGDNIIYNKQLVIQ
jgi:hypothetical protein